MNTLDTGWRMPAEWTPHAATWMAFPHNRMLWESEWGVSLADVQQDFAAVANAIARFEPVKLVVDPAALDRAGELCAGNVELIELAIDDSWCRDSDRVSSAIRNSGWPVSAGVSTPGVESPPTRRTPAWRGGFSMASAWSVSACRWPTRAGPSTWTARAR